MGGSDSDFATMLARAEADAQHATRDPNDPGVIAAARTRRRRRRIASGIVAATLVAGVGVYVPVTLLAELPAARATVVEPEVGQPAVFAPALPAVGSSAVSVIGAAGVEGGLDGLIAESGGGDPRPIASISKVITALLILEAKPLAPGEAGPTLAFGKAEADTYDKYFVLGATVESMRRGSAATQRDALELILAASASNYAEVVSTWAYGSQANFRAAAAAWLTKNGLTGTTIVEPTGIDPRNTSTPSDLIAIGRLALAHPVVAEIVASGSVEVEGRGTFRNRNDMLGVHGINGIKTGTLDGFGSNLLFSAAVEVGAPAPISVVGVVLGGRDRAAVNAAVTQLLDSVVAGFADLPLVSKGQSFGAYTTPWGETADLVAAEDASVLLWSNTPVTATISIRSVAVAEKGADVGSVTFVAGSTTVMVPLVLTRALEEPSMGWRLTHPVELLAP